MEAVLPYEIQIPSLRVQLDKVRVMNTAHLAQIELLDELRLKAAEHTQASLSEADSSSIQYNKKSKC